MTTESSDTSKQPAKPLLGIRLRLMLLALLARGAFQDHQRRSGFPGTLYGGEEFSLLLPGAGVEKAMLIAERLRRTVESLSFTNTKSPWGFVTVSVGVASLVPEKNETAEKLVEAADAGLYAAKHRGRNTVVAHEPVALSQAC